MSACCNKLIDLLYQPRYSKLPNTELWHQDLVCQPIDLDLKPVIKIQRLMPSIKMRQIVLDIHTLNLIVPLEAYLDRSLVIYRYFLLPILSDKK